MKRYMFLILFLLFAVSVDSKPLKQYIRSWKVKSKDFCIVEVRTTEIGKNAKIVRRKVVDLQEAISAKREIIELHFVDIPTISRFIQVKNGEMTVENL